MSEQFHVRLRKATHVFCAGHFITLTDQICEPVHGHNWTVGVDVVGSPDTHGMVIDFIALRNLLSDVLAQLDHRMLLPTLNRFLKLVTRPASADTMSGSEVEVQFTDRRWVFPAAECVLLPIENTTAEWLARWIGQALATAMTAAGSPLRGTLRIEVDECLGQSAVWEHRPD